MADRLEPIRSIEFNIRDGMLVPFGHPTRLKSRAGQSQCEPSTAREKLYSVHRSSLIVIRHVVPHDIGRRLKRESQRTVNWNLPCLILFPICTHVNIGATRRIAGRSESRASARGHLEST